MKLIEKYLLRQLRSTCTRKTEVYCATLRYYLFTALNKRSYQRFNQRIGLLYEAVKANSTLGLSKD